MPVSLNEPLGALQVCLSIRPSVCLSMCICAHSMSISSHIEFTHRLYRDFVRNYTTVIF